MPCITPLPCCLFLFANVVLARDPQSVVLYDSKGQFVGVRRPGSGNPIEVEGLRIVVDGIVGSTGLEIKSDPGVPWVYAGEGREGGEGWGGEGEEGRRGVGIKGALCRRPRV